MPLTSYISDGRCHNFCSLSKFARVHLDLSFPTDRHWNCKLLPLVETEERGVGWGRVLGDGSRQQLLTYRAVGLGQAYLRLAEGLSITQKWVLSTVAVGFAKHRGCSFQAPTATSRIFKTSWANRHAWKVHTSRGFHHLPSNHGFMYICRANGSSLCFLGPSKPSDQTGRTGAPADLDHPFGVSKECRRGLVGVQLPDTQTGWCRYQCFVCSLHLQSYILRR